MKYKASLIIILIILNCSAAAAQRNWVQQFLNRYREARSASASTWTTLQSGIVAQNGVISLTTEDVVRLLLENNRDVTAARLPPLSSYFEVTTLARPFEPNFHITPTASYSNTPSRNLLSGAPSLIVRSYDFLIGIDQTLPTGGAYSVDFDFNRFSSNSVFDTVNPAYNGLITFSFTQHLLRDFGKLPNTRQILVAQNNQKISEIQFEMQLIDLIAAAQRAYWDLVFSEEDLKVKKNSLDLAAQTLRDNEIQVQIGTLASIDVVQAQAEVATRRKDVITAQYDLIQLQDEIKKLITSETDPGLVLASLNPTERVQQPGARNLPSLTSAIQSALENRPEMRQATYDIQNQEINIQYAKNQLRPVLDFSAEYTQTGLAGTQKIRADQGRGEIIQEIRGSAGPVFNQLFGFDFPGYTAALNIRIPIRNRAARADLDRVVNEADFAARRKSAVAQQIALEVRNSYTQIEKSRAHVEAARTSLALAAQKLDAEQKKYELGASIIRFVLDEQRNLAQAQTDEIQALVEYTKSLVEVDRATGDTLLRNNIEIRKQLPRELATLNE